MITRVKIGNFRSLQDVEVHLKDFNVLVGLNGSGKSSFLEALELTRLFQEADTDILTQRGGFRSIVFGGDTGRVVRIEIEFLLPSAGNTSLVYSYSIAGGPVRYHWQSESLHRIEHDKIDPIFELDGRGFRRFDRDGTPMDDGSPSFRPRTVLSTFFGNPEFWGGDLWEEARKAVGSIRFHNLIPQRMHQPNPARKVNLFSPTGEQLSAVMHMIQSEQPEVFRDIERLLRAALPNLRSVKTGLTETGDTYIFFVEDGLDQPVSVWALSDGVRHLMGILLADAMTPTGGTLCLEEPENFVHQGWLDLIFDVLSGASEDKQVILTTHSAYFLDKVDPENLLLAEKRDGRTEIRSHTKKGLDKIREALKSLPLGELYSKGYLEPAE